MNSQVGRGWWTTRLVGRAHLAPLLFPKDNVRWRTATVLALSCLVAFLTFFNLTVYPSPDDMPGYIDDAQHLLAAKQLALGGTYNFGPAVGPTIIVPAAIAMRIFGVGHFAARLAMSLYLLLNLAAFYSLARRLGDWKTAVVAVVLYIGSPGIYLIYQGRRVMGEVPAAMFMLAALLVWLKALDDGRQRRRRGKMLLSGLLLGLAVLTKNQYLLLLPAFFVVWILDRVYYRQARHLDFLLPVISTTIVVITWYIAQWLLLSNGQQLAGHNLSQWTDAPSRGILTFSSQHMWEAIHYLNGSVLYSWVPPACLYAALRSFRRSKEGLQWALLFMVAAIWLGWFTFLSIAWYRYALPGLALSVLFAAHFFHAVTEGFRVPIRRFLSGQWDPALAARAVLAVVLAVMVARGLVGRTRDTLASGCETHLEMASYVSAHTPSDALVETYNPEICFLSDRACLLPSGSVQDAVIKYVWYDGPPPSQVYQLESPYLVIGYTSFYSGIYDLEVIKQDYELELSLGDNVNNAYFAPCRYDFYRKK